MEIFVPGRICLFGEHSDWAGHYRRINSELTQGYTLIAGTNQGLYATIEPHPTKLIFQSTLPDGSKPDPYEVIMDREVLLEEAQRGDYYSYVAGVAYQILTNYRVRGLKIYNYKTDLPIKKGLSSSAAVCVLVSRAFNRIYDLKMTVRGEMEYAYQGEITTPSRCGRMDQGCAYGDRPILMTYDGDRLDVQELQVRKPLYYVIVDLHASKDTKRILAQLNQCYPFAQNELQQKVQHYLGPMNEKITLDAIKTLEAGDARSLGNLMRVAQNEFDAHLMPACPSELTAPVLHKLLEYPAIQPYIYGGKGIGSQGDGSAQLLARDAESQDKAIEIIERDLHMSCLKLTLAAGKKVRKALIPAAGFSASHFPESKAMKKELFPIVDAKGRTKPVLLTIIEDAVHAGIEEIGIIVQPEDRSRLEDFFLAPPPIEHYNKLPKEDQDYNQYLEDIGTRIHFIVQDQQEGFGHALYCAKEWINDEPFLVMIGDHMYVSTADTSCAAQLMELYEQYQQNLVGLQITSVTTLKQYGCVTGTWKKDKELVSITEFSEKPDVNYARTHLQLSGLKTDEFATLFGLYILEPSIFTYLEQMVVNNSRVNGEFQLTPCLDQLRQEHGFLGYMMQGNHFDIGDPESYVKAMIAYHTLGKDNIRKR